VVDERGGNVVQLRALAGYLLTRLHLSREAVCRLRSEAPRFVKRYGFHFPSVMRRDLVGTAVPRNQELDITSGLVSKIVGLFGTELVTQSTRRKLDVATLDSGIFRNIPFQPTAMG